MGRPTSGWTLRKHGAIYYARFTAHGRRHEPSTGCLDVERASQIAARLYSEALRKPPGGRSQARRGSVLEAGEQWLNARRSSLGPRTVATYATHLEASIAPFFRDVERMTFERIEEYIAHRLERVQPQSVQKELSVVSGILGWVYKDPPPMPKVPARSLGTVAPKQKRLGPVDLTPAEVSRLLLAIPVLGYAGRPARAWFTVLYETGLRPSTVAALSVPEHYRRGERFLRVSRDIDKARAGRPLPLTGAAREALDSVCPKAGSIFGWHDYREQLRVSARNVLPPHKADAICPYDLRRARLTHWAERSRNLPGIQYLAGHARVSTTARYVRPTLMAAEAVLGEAAETPPQKQRKRRQKRAV